MQSFLRWLPSRPFACQCQFRAELRAFRVQGQGLRVLVNVAFLNEAVGEPILQRIHHQRRRDHHHELRSVQTQQAPSSGGIDADMHTHPNAKNR